MLPTHVASSHTPNIGWYTHIVHTAANSASHGECQINKQKIMPNLHYWVLLQMPDNLATWTLATKQIAAVKLRECKSTKLTDKAVSYAQPTMRMLHHFTSNASHSSVS